MTNKEFIEELSRRLEKTEKETASLLASFTECVSQSLQENKTVVLQDFGSFEVEKKDGVYFCESRHQTALSGTSRTGCQF